MQNQAKQGNLEPSIIELPHYSYETSGAGWNEDMWVDASFEELEKAALQPVKIRYVMPRKRGH